jgi:hypothetical protein
MPSLQNLFRKEARTSFQPVSATDNMVVIPLDLKEYKLGGQNVESSGEYLLSRHERERGNKVQQFSDGTVRRAMFLITQWSDFSIEDSTLVRKLRSYTQQKIGPPTLSRPTISSIG